MAAGEEIRFPFEIRLKNALLRQAAGADRFNVEADEPYKFSVYTELEVGTDDLTLDVKTHLDKDGMLIVEQLMTNRARTWPISAATCTPGHRWQRCRSIGWATTSTAKFIASQRQGTRRAREMLLEIEELNGPRVLKYRFVATAESDGSRCQRTRFECCDLPAIQKLSHADSR